jgi:Predicted periplasmic or secreted lipoprotein
MLALAVPGGITGSRADTKPVAPDNSGINVRDAQRDTATPENQSEKPADRDLTQKIRKAVVADDSLSMNAKNVKIITIDGMVTLRGPVNSDQERATIVAKATQLAGTGKVNNLLEVIPNKDASGANKSSKAGVAY